MGLFLCIVLLAGCRTPAVETAPTGGVAERVPAWQEFDESWVERADVIVVGKLDEYSYPCRFDEEGNSEMIAARSFEVVEVLAGDVKAGSINISQVFEEDACVPADFIEGRTYLVLLDPGPETLARLADPETVWGIHNEPHRGEVVAIVDLSQSREEAEALAVQASKSGEHGGYAFSPAGWETLRSSGVNDLGAQMQVLGFIRARVLAEGTTLGEVRSWLGEPDYWYASQAGFHYRYHLNAATREAPVEGMVSVQLGISFGMDLEILSYTVENLVCTRVDEHGDAWRDLTDEELAEHGLVNVQVGLK
jgi:hypothetical protein